MCPRPTTRASRGVPDAEALRALREGLPLDDGTRRARLASGPGVPGSSAGSRGAAARARRGSRSSSPRARTARCAGWAPRSVTRCVELVRVRIGGLGLGDAGAGRVAGAHGRGSRPCSSGADDSHPQTGGRPMILVAALLGARRRRSRHPGRANPRRSRAHRAGRGRRAPRPARPPRAQQPRGAHRAAGVRAPARPRPRGALPGREDGRRGCPARRPPRRCRGAARRSGRAAHRGDERSPFQEPDQGRHARLRPRRPHGDPARSRAGARRR